MKREEIIMFDVKVITNAIHEALFYEMTSFRSNGFTYEIICWKPNPVEIRNSRRICRIYRLNPAEKERNRITYLEINADNTSKVIWDDCLSEEDKKTFTDAFKNNNIMIA